MYGQVEKPNSQTRPKSKASAGGRLACSHTRNVRKPDNGPLLLIPHQSRVCALLQL